MQFQYNRLSRFSGKHKIRRPISGHRHRGDRYFNQIRWDKDGRRRETKCILSHGKYNNNTNNVKLYSVGEKLINYQGAAAEVRDFN